MGKNGLTAVFTTILRTFAESYGYYFSISFQSVRKDLQARDCALPAPLAHPGSFVSKGIR